MCYLSKSRRKLGTGHTCRALTPVNRPKYSRDTSISACAKTLIAESDALFPFLIGEANCLPNFMAGDFNTSPLGKCLKKTWLFVVICYSRIPNSRNQTALLSRFIRSLGKRWNDNPRSFVRLLPHTQHC